MHIPAEAYLTGIWEVSAKEKYEALEAARDYHANRSVCLAKQKRLPIYRICFLVMLLPLFGYFFSEFWQEELNSYMAIISTVYTPIALFFVIFRKNLFVPSLGSLVYIAEMFRLDDWTAIIPTTVPIAILCAIMYCYERDRRWLAEQPGFPAFHDVEVRVREEQMLTEREVPPPSAPVTDDPYSGILSDLQ